MPTPQERLQEKLAEIAFKKSEQNLRGLCEQHDGIKCMEFTTQVNGIKPEDHSAPFIFSSSIPLSRISSSMDCGWHRDWMQQQLRLLGEGELFFVAVRGGHPAWVAISCERGLEKLVELAVALTSRHSLSLYNPTTGESVFLRLDEYETLCFKHSIGREMK
jgi:hypothetical protein